MSRMGALWKCLSRTAPFGWPKPPWIPLRMSGPQNGRATTCQEVATRQAAVDEVKAAISTSEEAQGQRNLGIEWVVGSGTSRLCAACFWFARVKVWFQSRLCLSHLVFTRTREVCVCVCVRVWQPFPQDIWDTEVLALRSLPGDSTILTLRVRGNPNRRARV